MAHDIDSTRGPTFGDVTGHEEVNVVPHQNSVFQAVLKLLPWDAFAAAVNRHGGTVRPRGFSYKTQLLAMMYGQITQASSLREIELGLQSHAPRLYHLGARPASRSTLADANRDRPAAVFSDLLSTMIQSLHRSGRRAMDGVIYLIDSTNLVLNRRSADWAHFSYMSCGAKLHVIYDPAADRPIYAAVTARKVCDITAAQTMPIEAGATYVFDLGYYDYGWWATFDAAGCRIVTRLKNNTPLIVTETRPVAEDGPILSDRIGLLPPRLAKSRRNPFSRPIREVRVRIDTGKVLNIITNDLAASAQEIADLYKRRWAIELFFRWVKQSLQIKRFLGTSENAVRIQIAIALIVFLLLRSAQKAQTAITSPLAFARCVRATLMHNRSLAHIAKPPDRTNTPPGQGALQL